MSDLVEKLRADLSDHAREIVKLRVCLSNILAAKTADEAHAARQAALRHINGESGR